MRRILEKLLTHFLASLAGILRELHRARGPVGGAESAERLDLAVDQRVHRVDDQRPHAVTRRIVAQDHVEDRHEIGQALPRSGSGRDDVIVAAPRRRQCLGLVPMQPQIRSKKQRGVGQDRATRREFAQCRARLVSGVQLQNGFGPQLALGEPRTHELVDPRIENVDKALDVVPIFLDDVLPKTENIERHVRSRLPSEPSF